MSRLADSERHGADAAADTTGGAPGRFIEADLVCIRCGYNLRTLDRAGRCPECGLAVKVSLADPPLRYASMGTLRAARSGVALLAVFLGLVGLLDIISTVVMLNYYRLPQSAWLAMRYLRGHVDIDVHFAVAVATLLMGQPLRRAPAGLDQRIIWWAFGLAMGAGIGRLVLEMYPMIPASYAGISAGGLLRLAGLSALALLWQHLWQRADRAREPAAWWALRLTRPVTWLMVAMEVVGQIVWAQRWFGVPTVFPRSLLYSWYDVGDAGALLVLLVALLILVRTMEAIRRVR